MKRSARLALLPLLSALALACAAAAERGPERWAAGAARPAPGLEGREAPAAAQLRTAISLAFVRTGTPPVLVHGVRPGALPRVAPRTHAPGTPCAPTARTAVLGHARRPVGRHLARRMAAARDGTLSSRSTGVPPPQFA